MSASTDRAPLFWVASSFAAGIVFQWAFNLPLLLLAAGAGLGGAAYSNVRRIAVPANLALLILIGLLGACRAGMDARRAQESIARWITPESQPMGVRGIFVSDPEWASDYRTLSGWLRVEAVLGTSGWRAASGRLLARWPWRAGLPQYGDRFQLHGMIRAGRESGPAGRFDEAGWLWARGGDGILRVSAAEGMKTVGACSSLWVWYRRGVARFRQGLMGLGRSLMGPEDAAFLEALLLGDHQGMPKESWEAFRKTGTLHVLVVSGLHVGLVGFIFLIVLNLLPIERTARYLGLAGLLITYCVLTGAKIPILRSTVAGILFCYGRARGLAVSPLNLLGGAALLFLALTPRALADVSFQLSFSAVAGILLFSPALERWWIRNEESDSQESVSDKDGLFRRAWRYGAKGVAVSLSAWGATAPLIAWHFHSVNLLAPLFNLVVVPWASGLVAVGFLVYALGLVSPVAAKPFAAGFAFMAMELDGLVAKLANLPGTFWQW